MGGRIDTILMCVKFVDDPIRNLDFSFIGGVPLINFVASSKEQGEAKLFKGKPSVFLKKSYSSGSFL